MREVKKTVRKVVAFVVHEGRLAVFRQGQPPERWDGAETHDGQRPPTPLHFSWLPLGDPERDELAVGQATLLDKITIWAGQATAPPRIATRRGGALAPSCGPGRPRSAAALSANGPQQVKDRAAPTGG
ncbi:hypothetical protein [Streptoalloteichus tenebrarius]|uniref:hypothetical protein n=1 Tax=Streptoalloteichus tenebrarius (strain ATCC 17920 / DSM 40477 / JCM 4838 / CBS 697.72 / NBRC 16177 / NCIMB 11028 / NRRL B-12390 / A12253. 1 / ISP 5477) TaxID=1933 RepID=UPI0020A52EB2|nr:hypothetical protein [Streptoalloteichus tenebrarius]